MPNFVGLKGANLPLKKLLYPFLSNVNFAKSDFFKSDFRFNIFPDALYTCHNLISHLLRS